MVSCTGHSLPSCCASEDILDSVSSNHATAAAVGDSRSASRSGLRRRRRWLQAIVCLLLQKTRNSSGDEIANVNFLYDDIVHVLQNTIDSCIPPQIDAAVMCGTHVYQIQ